jgi:hypothetical protein
MIPCTAVSDRMPDVALGRSRWTTEEERHVATCAECRAEWAIVSAASRLRPRVTLDPDRVAGGALARLAADRARARTRSRVWTVAGLAAAAVVALAVWTGGSGVGSRRREPGVPARAPIAAAPPEVPRVPGTTPRGATSPAPVELAMPELDSLPEEALDSILRVLDEPLARAGDDDSQASDDGDLELERVLAGLEG